MIACPCFGDEGSSAVEFAIIIPVLLVLILGIYEFGRLYWIQNTLQYAAEQTGRCVMASTNGTSVTTISGTGATCPLSNNLGGLNSANVSVASNSVSQCTGGLSASKCQLITITYTFDFDDVLGGLMTLVAHGSSTSLPSITLSGQATVPIG